MLQEEFGGGSAGPGWIQAYQEFIERSEALISTNLESDTLGPDANTDDFNLDSRNHSHEEFLYILRRTSMQRGVSVEDVLGGVRRFEVVEVRRLVLKECSEKMDVTLSLLSRWLGMKENTAAYHLKSSSRSRR
jgi:hypothetical protein